MIVRPNRYAVAIAAALDKHAAQVTQRHAMAWDVIFRNGTELTARVELVDELVKIDSPLPTALTTEAPNVTVGGRRSLGAENDDRVPASARLESGPPSGAVVIECDAFWSLLVRNASLPSGVKLALAVGDALAPPVRLCGEITLDDAAEPAVRVRDLCAAIKQVAHVWPLSEPAPAAETMLTAAADVAALCRDTGWPMVERDGGVLIEVDLPDGFAQAHVGARPDGGIAAAVAVGDGQPPAQCRNALALLLLRASRSVHLVRAAAAPAPRLEVALPAPVTAPTLQHALCALSVAYRLVMREAAALVQDAAIAAAYLRHAPPLATLTVT